MRTANDDIIASQERVRWRRPMLLLSIFGLGSLLGASNSATTALGLGVATTIALLVVHVFASLVPRTLPPPARAGAIVFIAGSVLGCLELAMNAFWHDLYKALGFFLPLVVVACLVAARPDTEQLVQTTRAAAVSGLKMGCGFLIVSLVLGIARELVGHGSIFHDAGVLLGSWATPLDRTFFRTDLGFVLAILAPGAFIALGFLLAIYQWLSESLRRKQAERRPKEAAL